MGFSSQTASECSRDTVLRVSRSSAEQAPESPPDRRIWLDGELVSWDRATVHILSHSLQRGSLIFDFLSVHESPRGQAIFRLREHVERLLRSAELVGLPLRMSAEEISEWSHAEPAWEQLEIGESIPYDTAYLAQPILTPGIREHALGLLERIRT